MDKLFDRTPNYKVDRFADETPEFAVEKIKELLAERGVPNDYEMYNMSQYYRAYKQGASDEYAPLFEYSVKFRQTGVVLRVCLMKKFRHLSSPTERKYKLNFEHIMRIGDPKFLQAITGCALIEKDTEIARLNEKIARLEERIIELEMSPDPGAGYLAAKASFDEKVNPSQ